MLRLLLLICTLLAVPSTLLAQVTIAGRVVDAETGEAMGGVRVFTADRKAGALSGDDGAFNIAYPGTLPVRLVATSEGFDSASVDVADASRPVTLRMAVIASTTEEVSIIGQQISEQQQQDPRTAERMDVIAIKETAAASFYDALGNLRGVDITSASMGFKIINTRGFNSTAPVRSLQLIDGYDNASPGLNFSLGNLVGSSELDVQSVDIIQGAGSVAYGPGAFNGVIAMTTRDPFVHRGLAAQIKVGERELFDAAFRYAHVVSNRHGREFLAFKVNAAFMSANDWEATNATPTSQSARTQGNPGGYDAINRYGDENATYLAPFDFSSPSQWRNFPGLDVFFRSGYWEQDIVDYRTRSMKVNAAAYWKLHDSLTLGYSYNLGTGTTVFQGDNRYALRDLVFMQHRLELTGKHFSLKAYTTQENAGRSYDAVFTALLLQRQQKTDAQWVNDYRRDYGNALVAQGVNLSSGRPDLIEAYLAQNPQLVNYAHSRGRTYADGEVLPIQDNSGGYAFLQPGTPEFSAALRDITSNPSFNDGGSRFVSNSRFYHVQGDYHLSEDRFYNIVDVKVGARYRIYAPETFGTVFSDTTIVEDSLTGLTRRQDISIWEVGAHLLLEKRLLNDRIILSAGTRVDKSRYFDPIVSPAVSAVFQVKRRHYLRVNAFNAVRNPTLQDQFLYYNVGRARLVGNLNGLNDVVLLDEYINVLNNALSSPTDSLRNLAFNIQPIRPEVARTLEFGYKGNPVDRLFLDATFWYSLYQDFIGYNIVSPAPDSGTTSPVPEPLRVSANATDDVTTLGVTVGLNFYFAKFYGLVANYTFTELAAAENDPIIPAYNTPRHKFNVGLGGRDIKYTIGLGGERSLKIKNIGFNANVKWVEGFLFEGSPQFTGLVETYWTVDAQVTYSVPKWWGTTFKLGASNLLNRKYIQVYGGPEIGRLAYFQVSLDLRNPY